MAKPRNRNAARILLVEDDPDDIDLTLEAFRESGSLHELFVVENGVEALDFLRQREGFKDMPAPDLVLLDLNLPKKSGHEVLAVIKTDPSLRRIPVVVLTSSAAESDERRAGELEANGYITKPTDLSDFLRLVRIIDGFCAGKLATAGI